MLIVVGMLSAVAWGSEGADKAHDDHENHPHRHHVALFLGATDREKGHDTEPTIGADYEFRFHRIFGAAALIDSAWKETETTVVGAGIFVHPHGGLKFLLAPGLEEHHGHNEFMVRVGAAYDFHVGSFSISPTVNVDFVDGKGAVVYGLAFGYGF